MEVFNKGILYWYSFILIDMFLLINDEVELLLRIIKWELIIKDVVVELGVYIDSFFMV